MSRAIKQKEIEEQLAGGSTSGHLPFFHFVASDGGDVPLWRCAAYVIRVRAGGFMMMLPGDEEIVAFFEGALSPDAEQFAY